MVSPSPHWAPRIALCTAGHSTGTVIRLRVVVPLIASLVRGVESDLHSHAVTFHQQLANLPSQRPALFGRKFVGQGHQHFARDTRVLPRLVFFNLGPELVRIQCPRRRVSGGQHVHGKHAGFAAVAVACTAGIVQVETSPVSGGSGRAVALPSAETFHLNAVDRHCPKLRCTAAPSGGEDWGEGDAQGVAFGCRGEALTARFCEAKP